MWMGCGGGGVKILWYNILTSTPPEQILDKWHLHFDNGIQCQLIIMCYKRIGYNLNVMRQSACLVINPITVDGYATLFNCPPVDRASDSMMAPT